MEQSSNIQRLQEAGFAIKDSLPDQYKEVFDGLAPDDVDLLVSTSELLTRVQRDLELAARRDPEADHYSAYLLVPPF